MTNIKLAFAVAGLALMTVACSSSSGTAATRATVPTTSNARSLAAYAFYLAHNPDPALVLSRENAQVRAYLGCGIKWSPGTVDGVLAQAYNGVCPSTPGNFP